MIKGERYQKILDFLENKGYCANEIISADLDIPLTTLRRDLQELHDQKKIIRVHGGATLATENSNYEINIDEKLITNIEAKKNIANQAMNIIKENSSIFLDAGSSTYYIAQLINNKLECKIYTTSILNAQILFNNGCKNIFIIGGNLKSITGAITGIEAIKIIEKHYFDYSFIGVNAIDEKGLLYTTDDDEAQVKNIAIKNSNKSYILADTKKFNKKSFVRFADGLLFNILKEEN